MNVVTRSEMTLEQFLAWEERQVERWEFDGTRPVAMTGGTKAHALIQANLLRVIGNALVGRPCSVFGSHLKVVTSRSVRYPDAFVTCAAFDPKATIETAPVVIFEILSPSTAEQDFTEKNAEYRAMPSVQRYVVFEQAHVGATVFHRHGEFWVTDRLSGADAILDMPEIAVSVTLGDIFTEVNLGDDGGVVSPAV